MQIVILAGGLATRLGKLSLNTPKSMITIEGKPFLEYQIDLLKDQGINEIILCVSHLGEKIKSYFGNGENFRVHISYSLEKNPLGTGGALKNAQKLLSDEFMMLYGDSYLPIDYNYVINAFRDFGTLGTMVVYKNCDKYDKSNVILDGTRIKFYEKNMKHPNMVYIDAGLSIFKKDILKTFSKGKNFSLDIIIKDLISRRQLSAFETEQRFYEIGSINGLRDFREYIKSKTPPLEVGFPGSSS